MNPIPGQSAQAWQRASHSAPPVGCGAVGSRSSQICPGIPVPTVGIVGIGAIAGAAGIAGGAIGAMGGGAMGAMGGGAMGAMGGGAIGGAAGGGGNIGAAGGGGGGGGGVGRPYGPPAHTGLVGWVMQPGSAGPVGMSYGPPRHGATVGIAAHLGSSGLVGRPESGPGGGGGVAAAGTVTPAAAKPTSAAATAVPVIAPRTLEAMCRLISRSPGRNAAHHALPFAVMACRRRSSHDPFLFEDDFDESHSQRGIGSAEKFSQLAAPSARRSLRTPNECEALRDASLRR